MYSVELLAEAIAAARLGGFEIREEWLAGAGGGACVVRGRKVLFLDLSLSPRDRLDQVLEALQIEPAIAVERVSATLARVLRAAKAAS